MTPHTLLSLWRTRWGKADIGASAKPLQTGRLSAWGDTLADSSLWRVPGLGLLTMLLWGAVVLVLTPAALSPIQQLSLSLMWLLPSLLLRRSQGQWITHLLLGFALICTCRYLYWRIVHSVDWGNPDAGFWVALGLLAAESLYMAHVALCIANRWMPVVEPTDTLPDAVADWPTVGVFIVCTGQRLASIEATLRAATDIAWPRLKITLYFVDAVARDGVRKFLNANNAVYLAYPPPAEDAQTPATKGKPQPSASAITVLNRALSDAKEDLCVLLTMGDVPIKNCLVSTLGWFLRDPTLGVICTPGHFLVPSVRPSLTGRLVARPAATASASTPGATAPAAPADSGWMVLRRNMLLSLGGLPDAPDAPDAPVTHRKHIAQVMHRSGLKHAFVVQAGDLPQWGWGAVAATPPESWYRLNTPFGRGSWWLRCLFHRLKTSLDASVPLLHRVFWVTPMIFLLTGVQPVQASVAILLSYAVPHVLQGWLLYQRLYAPVHLTLWLELQEAFWALYILVLTALIATLTKIRRVVDAWKTRLQSVQGRVFWPLSVADMLLTAGWGGSVIAGLTMLQRSDASLWIDTLFYGAWCGMGLMLVAAKLAVAEDAQDERLHRLLRMQMPAMLRLPNRRTVACSTCNFPQTHLQLAVPVALPLRVDDAVQISIFQGLEESAFAARVQSADGLAVCVRIDPDHQAGYAALAGAVSTRGQDWPQWLPDRDADQLVPDWMSDALQWPVLAWMNLWNRLAQPKPVAANPVATTPRKPLP